MQVAVLRRNDLNSHSFHVELRDEPGSRHRVRIRFTQQVTFLSRGAILQEFCEIPDVLEILHDFKSSAESRDLIVDTIDYSDEPVAIPRVGRPRSCLLRLHNLPNNGVMADA